MPKAKLLDLDALLPYEPAWAVINPSGQVFATFSNRTEAEFYVKERNLAVERVDSMTTQVLRVIKTMVAIEA